VANPSIVFISELSRASQRSAFRRRLLAWYRANGRDLPWRGTRDPYAILVSEFMLQQTQVATVLPYYSEWLKRFRDFKSLAGASESDVLHAWQGLGYYSRARNLHAVAKSIVADFSGLFPTDPHEMRKLPGLGRYTANAVATFAFDQTVPVVEANIARCLTRLFDLQIRIDSAEGQRRLWELAAAMLPVRAAGEYNSALMDLGATICIAGRPKCFACPVNRFCRTSEPEKLPIKKARPAILRLTERHEFVLVDRRILLERSSERWRGMWILPRLVNVPNPKRPLHSIVFPFTHHRVTLEVYNVQRLNITPESSQSWFEASEVESIPMPSPHRRALGHLLSFPRS
jgi:A/G-specific adenine glycosylase